MKIDNMNQNNIQTFHFQYFRLRIQNGKTMKIKYITA